MRSTETDYIAYVKEMPNNGTILEFMLIYKLQNI